MKSVVGTFAQELSSFQLLPHACDGEKGEESLSFLPVHISYWYGRKQPLADKVTTAFSRAPNTQQHPLGIIFYLCSMFSGGGAWLGMVIPQSTEIGTCVCRSCRVKIVFWGLRPTLFSRGKKQGRSPRKANDTALDASLC